MYALCLVFVYCHVDKDADWDPLCMMIEGIGIKLYLDQNASWLYDMAFIDLPVGLGDRECIKHLYVVMCVYQVC